MPISLLERLSDLRDRAERRGPITEAVNANFEPGKRGERVELGAVHEVVALAMGVNATETEHPTSGWARRFPKAVYVTARIELARMFGARVSGRAWDGAGIAGLRWRADAPLRARVEEIREAASRRRYGL